MGQVGSELNRTVRLGYDAAIVAANLDFVAVNLRNSGGFPIYITGIDATIFADVADSANIDLFTVQILRNVVINPSIAIASQVQSQTLIWIQRSQRVGDRAFVSRFFNPLELEADSLYSVLAFIGFTAALVAPADIRLTVLGKFGESKLGKENTYFGEPR